MKRLSKLRHLAAAAGLFLLMAPDAAAAEKATAVAGAGGTTCAVFASRYKENIEKVENVYFTWAQGFMSGLNTGLIASHSETPDLHPNDFDTEDQQRYIRHYCDQHPLADYYAAVMDLYMEMREKQGLPLWPPK